MFHRMKKTNYFILFVVILSFAACKTSQPIRPMEQYLQEGIEEKISNINLPLKIHIRELEKSINKQLPDPLYRDSSTTDGDNMSIIAKRREDITLGVDSQQITYRVPLILDIKYDIGFTKVNAFGEIALNFKTAFNILENWELQTSTILVSHEWLQTPKLKLAGVSLPIGFIANIIINRSREELTKAIDEQVSVNFDFKKAIEDTWKNMFAPMLVSEEYNAWLNINPIDIGMTSMVTDKDTIMSTVIIASKPKITLGRKPESTTWHPLPLFKYRPAGEESFTLFLNTDISYDQAEKIAKDQILGETYSSGNKSVTIEDIELYGQADQLIVNTKLSGSYNGSVYMEGKPTFNRKKNSIDIKDLNFTLDTKNFLIKSAGWLLKSTIKKQIQDNLDFILDYNLSEMEKQIQSQLANYSFQDGISLKGNLEGLNIENAYLTPQGMRVVIALNGKLGMQISGFSY